MSHVPFPQNQPAKVGVCFRSEEARFCSVIEAWRHCARIAGPSLSASKQQE